MKARRQIILLSFALLLAPTPCGAQQDVRNIFPDEGEHAPVARKKGSKGAPASDSEFFKDRMPLFQGNAVKSHWQKDRESATAGNDRANGQEDRSEEQAGPDMKQAARSIMDQAQGTKINSISAVLNGVDREHYGRKLAELYSLAKKHQLRIETIYVLGSPQQAINRAAMDLLSDGVMIVPCEKPPEEYPVTQSPSWIIKLDEGIVLLEGVPLARVINARGELVPQPGQAAAEKLGNF